MGKMLWKKISESLLSVSPVLVIVLVLNFTPLASLSAMELLTFFLSAVFLIAGIAFFNLGADVAMTPMGEHVGAGLAGKTSLKILLSVCFVLGVVITVAEPDLSVLASQVEAILSSAALVCLVGSGVGIFLVLAIVRIVTGKSLSGILLFFYLILFSLASLVVVNGNGSFLALAFDSGGVTTGPITVPFIMALGIGVASSLGGKNSKENSFGLIALCSIGPVLAVLCLGIFAKGDVPYALPDYSVQSLSGMLGIFVEMLRDVGIALGIPVAFFALLQIFLLRLPKRKLLHIGVGLLFAYVGLVIFLTAVHIGFMPVGYKLGAQLARSPVALVICGFVLGAVVVLAEPAIHVLNRQVEDVTGGTVSRRSMLVALCVGVGISLGLSMLRIVFDFNILYYLIPGYILSLGLSFFVPPLYTAIAFDSGGVASGPLTSTFILPFAIGACCALQGVESVMADAFGVVAMVAMTPLISIQLLGFRAVVADKMRRRIAMKRILSADDEQIIRFM